VLDPAAALDLVRGAPERAVRLRDLAVRRIGGASGRLVVSAEVVNATRTDAAGLTLAAGLDGGAPETTELASLPALGARRVEIPLAAAPGAHAVALSLSRGADDLDRRDLEVTVPAEMPVRLPVAAGPPSIEWRGTSAAVSYDATIYNPADAERAVRVQVAVDDSVVQQETRTVPAGGDLVVPVAWTAGPLDQPIDLSLEVRVTPADAGAGEAEAATSRRWRVVRLSRDTISMHLQYAQPNTTLHVVVDAPWMTMRDYVPIMVYVPLRPAGPLGRTRISGIDLTRDAPGLDFEPDANRILFDTCDDWGEGAVGDVPINLADWLRMNANLGAGLIGPLGDPVELTGLACELRDDHWHVIYRIPWAWLGGLRPFRYTAVTVGVRQMISQPYDPVDESGIAHITSGTGYAGARYSAMPQVVNTTYRKVLRFFREQAGLPKFDERDHYYDGHVHMYSEHTIDRGTLAPLKNFGGPLAMLVESSYALGFVDRPLAPNGFGAYKDQLVLTNHNAFYSGPPYDAGSVPFYGPLRGASLLNQPTGPLLAAFPGSQEFDWHRMTFGKFAGEEVDLASRHVGQDGGIASQQLLRLGHHFLVYDAEHFEGPWHGGNVTEALKILAPRTGHAAAALLGDVANPNPLDSVLTRMHDHGEDGFGYAAHPEAPMFLWPESYFDLAIGREETGNNSRTGDYVRMPQQEFVFKGAQVWNAKTELEAKYTPEQLLAQSPFSGRWGPRFQRSDAWEDALETGLRAYRERLTWGLSYNFAESPEDVFIRKNFMVAGTDAHGDFNYGEDVLTTNFVAFGAAVDDLKPTLGSNAYGRVRTYVLAHDGEGVFGGSTSSVTGRQQDAYRRGQSVLTDGPICEWWLDSSGRHNPAAGIQRWHDAEEKFENVEGRIGGSGAFDGGRTLLTTNQQNNAVFSRTRWLPSQSPYAGSIERFTYDRVNKERSNTGGFAAGPPGSPQESKLPDAFNDWARGAEALILHGKAPVKVQNPDAAHSFEGTERCIANPIWVIPSAIEIEAPESCPIRPGALKATFYFPNTIGSSDGVFVRPLDRTGVSENPETPLVPQPGWKLWRADQGLVRNGAYIAVNEEPIACPSGPWDAVQHAPSTNRLSYVVYMKNPTDLHGEKLNDVGDTFVVGLPGLIPDSTRLPPPEDSIPPRQPPPQDSIPPQDSVPPTPPDSVPPAQDSIPPVTEDSVPPVTEDSVPPVAEDSVPPAEDTGDIFEGVDVDPGILNDPILDGGPRLPGMQRFVMELPALRLGPAGGVAGGGGGSGSSGPSAADLEIAVRGSEGWPPQPRLYISGLGNSTGEAFQIQAANLGDAPLELPAGALVVEPVDLGSRAGKQLADQLSRIGDLDPGAVVQRTLDGYCVNIGLGVPPTGTTFRVASRALQQQFAPMRGILDVSRALYDAGGLHPDSDPEGYFHSIRQWAIWTRIEEFDQKGYEDAFVAHTKKNFEAAGRDWNGEIEKVVRSVVPNRWQDIQAVLERAR
jgi:hypothetical protein